LRRRWYEDMSRRMGGGGFAVGKRGWWAGADGRGNETSGGCAKPVERTAASPGGKIGAAGYLCIQLPGGESGRGSEGPERRSRQGKPGGRRAGVDDPVPDAWRSGKGGRRVDSGAAFQGEERSERSRLLGQGAGVVVRKLEGQPVSGLPAGSGSGGGATRERRAVHRSAPSEFGASDGAATAADTFESSRPPQHAIRCASAASLRPGDNPDAIAGKPPDGDGPGHGEKLAYRGDRTLGRETRDAVWPESGIVHDGEDGDVRFSGAGAGRLYPAGGNSDVPEADDPGRKRG